MPRYRILNYEKYRVKRISPSTPDPRHLVEPFHICGHMGVHAHTHSFFPIYVYFFFFSFFFLIGYCKMFSIVPCAIQ